MKKIVVLGCGLVGRVMAEDLSQYHRVTSVDISKENLDKIHSSNISKVCKDVSDISVLNDVIKDCDLVVGALPGFMGCLLYTSPSPRDLSTSRMPSSA